MEIADTALYNEVELITNNGVKAIHSYYRAELHIDDNNYDILKVIQADIVRDYQKNIADEMTVTLAIPLGLWAKVIYPNRSILEISLFKEPLNTNSGSENKGANTQSQRYGASPVLEGLPVFQGSDLNKISQETLDLRDILTIHFQLFSKTVEKLRMVSVGGIFRNTTNANVIKGLLAAESNKVKVDTGDTIEAVDMVPATNTTKKDHCIIPHGTKLIDLPRYIQDKCGGVYSTGLNSYIQDRNWYVYPLYDTTRLNKAQKTLTIVKVPKTLLTGVESTYRVEGDSVFILATSDSNFDDDAGTNFLNYGNGARFSDAKSFLNNPVQTKGNKAIAVRSNLNNEFVSTNVSDYNNVIRSDRAINANPFREYSKLAAITGGTYTLAWENADPSLLFPGMMVRILYLNGKDIDEIHGVLMYVHVSVQLIGQAITARRHSTNTALAVFVNKPPKR